MATCARRRSRRHRADLDPGDPGQQSDSRPVVFLAPGIDGDEPRTRGVPGRVRRPAPFRRPEISRPLEAADPASTFKRIVQSVCDQIEAAAGAGTVRLAGYSFGGLVAYAAAQRLSRSGARGRLPRHPGHRPAVRLGFCARPVTGLVHPAKQLAAEIRERGWLSRASVQALPGPASSAIASVAVWRTRLGGGVARFPVPARIANPRSDGMREGGGCAIWSRPGSRSAPSCSGPRNTRRGRQPISAGRP